MQKSEQVQMEEQINEQCKELFTGEKEHLYERIKMEIVSCSAQDQSLTMRFPVLEWELNHLSTMHGGVIATAIDTTSGLLVYNRTGRSAIVTTSMNINYLSPVLKGDKLMVTARIDRLGRHLINVSARAYGEGSNRTAATAQINFMLMKD